MKNLCALRALDIIITLYVCVMIKIEDRITDVAPKLILDDSLLWEYIVPLREKQTEYLVKKYGCVAEAIKQLGLSENIIG